MRHTVHIGDAAAVLRENRERFRVAYLDPPYGTRTTKCYGDGAAPDEWTRAFAEVLAALHPRLREDGVAFASIDDTMLPAMRAAFDREFGAANRVGTFVTMQARRSNSRHVNTCHEYVLAYAADRRKLPPFRVRRMDSPAQRAVIERLSGVARAGLAKSGADLARRELRAAAARISADPAFVWVRNFTEVDADGRVYFPQDLSLPVTTTRPPRTVDIPQIGIHLDPLPTRAWPTDAVFLDLAARGLLCMKGGAGRRGGSPSYRKRYIEDAEDAVGSILPFYSRQGSADLAALGLRDAFDNPKPVELVKFLIRITGAGGGDAVLDCYGGSGTTAQAVMELNAEPGREPLTFELIQRPEPMNPKSLAYKACLALGIEPHVETVLAERLKRAAARLGDTTPIDFFKEP